MLVEALEDGRRVLGGHAREQLARLVRLELAHDVGEVLGVDLVEQLAHLIRILLEDLLDVGAEQAAEAHGLGRSLGQAQRGIDIQWLPCAYPHCCRTCCISCAAPRRCSAAPAAASRPPGGRA